MSELVKTMMEWLINNFITIIAFAIITTLV